MDIEREENMAQEREDTVLLSDFRYSEVLCKFQDVVDAEFKFNFDDQYVFRTVVNNPPDDKDTLPKHRRQELESGMPYEFQFSEEEIAEMSYKNKKDQVTREAMSVHKSLEKAKSEAIRAYRKQKERFGDEAAQRFIVERGCYIARLCITKETGIMTDFHRTTKHANVLLKNGVSMNDILDPSFEIVKFSYPE